jgi:sec-independent protein translocase protein TatC
MRRTNAPADSEDHFAETRMSFGEHIEELRSHMIRAIVGFVAGMLICFLPPIGEPILKFIQAPVVNQLKLFYQKRVAKVAEELDHGEANAVAMNEARELPIQLRLSELRHALGVKAPEEAAQADPEQDWVTVSCRVEPLRWMIALQDAERVVGRRATLSTMNIMEGFMVYFKVCAMAGIVLTSPWIFLQMWAFIAAGLYRHEKKYVHYYLPFSLGLFLIGVAVCEFAVIPKAVQGLLAFNEWLGLEPDLRLNEWLSFAIMLPLVFGVSFQTPLVMLFLGKIGILDANSFRKKRRIAWFTMAILCAIITPVDALSMVMLWVPMCLLYELGILLVQYTARKPEDEFESKPDELVEV